MAPQVRNHQCSICLQYFTKNGIANHVKRCREKNPDRRQQTLRSAFFKQLKKKSPDKKKSLSPLRRLLAPLRCSTSQNIATTTSITTTKTDKDPTPIVKSSATSTCTTTNSSPEETVNDFSVPTPSDKSSVIEALPEDKENVSAAPTPSEKSSVIGDPPKDNGTVSVAPTPSENSSIDEANMIDVIDLTTSSVEDVQYNSDEFQKSPIWNLSSAEDVSPPDSDDEEDYSVTFDTQADPWEKKVSKGAKLDSSRIELSKVKAYKKRDSWKGDKDLEDDLKEIGSKFNNIPVIKRASYDMIYSPNKKCFRVIFERIPKNCWSVVLGRQKWLTDEHMKPKCLRYGRKLLDEIHQEDSRYHRAHGACNSYAMNKREHRERNLITNSMFQIGEINTGMWSDMEKEALYLPNKYDNPWCFTGTLFNGDDIKVFGTNSKFQIAVPDECVKVFLMKHQDEDEEEQEFSYFFDAYQITNEEGGDKELANYRVKDVDSIFDQDGFKLFGETIETKMSPINIIKEWESLKKGK